MYWGRQNWRGALAPYGDGAVISHDPVIATAVRGEPLRSLLLDRDGWGEQGSGGRGARGIGRDISRQVY